MKFVHRLSLSILTIFSLFLIGIGAFAAISAGGRAAISTVVSAPIAAPAPPSHPSTTPATTVPAALTNTPVPTAATGESITQPAVGRVVWVKGSFTAVTLTKAKRQLQKTSLIYLHDTLFTDGSTQAEIVFTDNTLMTFRPATQFFIDEYSYQPRPPQQKKGSVGKYVMSLIEGGFRTITGLIPKANPPDYQVNTPVATIGVRGTDYVAYVHGGELYVGYNSGKPCVKSQKGNEELCLDKNTRYARVPYPGAAPVPLSQQPSVFDEKLDVVPAIISSFTSSGGGFSGGGGGGGGTCPIDGGPVTNFDIGNF